MTEQWFPSCTHSPSLSSTWPELFLASRLQKQEPSTCRTSHLLSGRCWQTWYLVSSCPEVHHSSPVAESREARQTSSSRREARPTHPDQLLALSRDPHGGQARWSRFHEIRKRRRTEPAARRL